MVPQVAHEPLSWKMLDFCVFLHFLLWFGSVGVFPVKINLAKIIVKCYSDNH